MKSGARIHWPSALVFLAAVTFLIVILIRVVLSGSLVASLIALALFLGLMGLLARYSLTS